jgi:hypothetical protein
MDLELLREVSVSKPFRGKYREVPKNWETVVDNLKWRTISVKTARRRFELLLKKFRTDEGISLKRQVSFIVALSFNKVKFIYLQLGDRGGVQREDAIIDGHQRVH